MMMSVCGYVTSVSGCDSIVNDADSRYGGIFYD